jgi:hypothetical protein
MPTYYKRDNTGTTNWNLATSWSTVSSTSAINTGPFPSFPSSATADPVIFDANSSNVTINVASVCTSVSCTLYTGQITFTNSLSVRGSVTFSAGMTTTGTGNLIITGTSTLTSNSVQLSGGLQFTPFTFSLTGTIADNWTIVGSLSRTGANGYTIAGSGGVRTITVQGSFTGGLTITNITIRMTGNGSLSGGAGSGGSGSIEIDTAGTISHNGTFSLNGIVFTYINGTFNSTATLGCGANTSVFNNWGNISRAFFAFDWNVNLGGQSVTLNSDIYVTNNLTFTGNAGGNFNGVGRTVFIYGNISGAGNGLGGTATIQMEGSTNASITIASIQNNLTINKTGIATLTLNSFTWGGTGRTLQRTSGNINPGASTITLADASSVTINDMTFWNLTIPCGPVNLPTITQNVLNTIQSNLTFGAFGSVVFAGTAGWTCANLICSTAGRTITLQSLVTYTTTTSVNMLGSNAARILMRSSDLTIPYDLAIWTLVNGATQSIIYVSATAIDSSLGQTIWSFQGTTNGIDPSTLNWNPGTKPETQGITFVN